MIIYNVGNDDNNDADYTDALMTTTQCPKAMEGGGGGKRFWNLIQKMIVLGSPGLIELCFNNITPFLEVSGHRGVQKWSKFSWKLAENGCLSDLGHMVLPNGWIRVDPDWI